MNTYFSAPSCTNTHYFFEKPIALQILERPCIHHGLFSKFKKVLNFDQKKEKLAVCKFESLEAPQAYLPATVVLTAAALSSLKRKQVIRSVLKTFYCVTFENVLFFNGFFILKVNASVYNVNIFNTISRLNSTFTSLMAWLEFLFFLLL